MDPQPQTFTSISKQIEDSQLNNKFQSGIHELRRKQPSQTSFTSSKKKLSEIHENLRELQQKFSHFQNTLKEIKGNGMDSFQIRTPKNQSNSKGSPQPKYKAKRKPIVQKLLSKQQGCKAIRIDNKIYNCKNIPISYFQNVQALVQTSRKINHVTKKRAIEQRSKQNLRLVKGEPRLGLNEQNNQLEHHKTQNNQNCGERAGLQILGKKKEGCELEITESRTKQLQECKRMMNNRNRANRYCDCCSRDSPSPSLENSSSRYPAKNNQYCKSSRMITQRYHSPIFDQNCGQILPTAGQKKTDNKSKANPQNNQMYDGSKQDNYCRQDSARTKKFKITNKGDRLFIGKQNLSSKLNGVKFKKTKQQQPALLIDSIHFLNEAFNKIEQKEEESLAYFAKPGINCERKTNNQRKMTVDKPNCNIQMDPLLTFKQARRPQTSNFTRKIDNTSYQKLNQGLQKQEQINETITKRQMVTARIGSSEDTEKQLKDKKYQGKFISNMEIVKGETNKEGEKGERTLKQKNLSQRQTKKKKYVMNRTIENQETLSRIEQTLKQQISYEISGAKPEINIIEIPPENQQKIKARELKTHRDNEKKAVLQLSLRKSSETDMGIFQENLVKKKRNMKLYGGQQLFCTQIWKQGDGKQEAENWKRQKLYNAIYLISEEQEQHSLRISNAEIPQAKQQEPIDQRNQNLNVAYKPCPSPKQDPSLPEVTHDLQSQSETNKKYQWEQNMKGKPSPPTASSQDHEPQLQHFQPIHPPAALDTAVDIQETIKGQYVSTRSNDDIVYVKCPAQNTKRKCEQEKQKQSNNQIFETNNFVRIQSECQQNKQDGGRSQAGQNTHSKHTMHGTQLQKYPSNHHLDCLSQPNLHEQISANSHPEKFEPSQCIQKVSEVEVINKNSTENQKSIALNDKDPEIHQSQSPICASDGSSFGKDMREIHLQADHITLLAVHHEMNMEKLEEGKIGKTSPKDSSIKKLMSIDSSFALLQEKGLEASHILSEQHQNAVTISVNSRKASIQSLISNSSKQVIEHIESEEYFLQAPDIDRVEQRINMVKNSFKKEDKKEKNSCRLIGYTDSQVVITQQTKTIEDTSHFLAESIVKKYESIPNEPFPQNSSKILGDSKAQLPHPQQAILAEQLKRDIGVQCISILKDFIEQPSLIENSPTKKQAKAHIQLSQANFPCFTKPKVLPGHVLQSCFLGPQVCIPSIKASMNNDVQTVKQLRNQTIFNNYSQNEQVSQKMGFPLKESQQLQQQVDGQKNKSSKICRLNLFSKTFEIMQDPGIHHHISGSPSFVWGPERSGQRVKKEDENIQILNKSKGMMDKVEKGARIEEEKQVQAKIAPLILIRQEKSTRSDCYIRLMSEGQKTIIESHKSIIGQILHFLQMKLHDLLSRLITPTKNQSLLWFYQKQFQYFEIRQPQFFNSPQLCFDLLFSTFYQGQKFQDFRTYLQSLIGCPMLKLVKTQWNKVKNINRHRNIFGFALAPRQEIHRIMGTELGKQNIKMVKMKKPNGKCLNLTWQKFLCTYQNPFLLAFNKQYFVRSIHIPITNKCHIVDLSMNSYNDQTVEDEKVHCVLSLESTRSSGALVTVYEQVGPNKYQNMGTGEASFVSMSLKSRNYMLLFDDCQESTVSLCSSHYLELSNGRCANDRNQAIYTNGEKLLKCDQF